jgi:hypothetical protein
VCLLAAVCIGIVDLNVKPVQIPAALLLGVTALLSFWRPRRAWARALFLGMSVPAAHAVANASGFRPPYAFEPNGAAALIALIPAAIGAALGAGARWAVAEAKPA